MSCLYVCVLSVEIKSLVLVVNLCVGLAHKGCLEEEAGRLRECERILDSGESGVIVISEHY